MAGRINYNKRDFEGIRSELINYAKANYQLDFTPASIDLLLIELISGVGDMLSYQTDRKFQETQLEYAQERKNILAHAKTMGLHIPNKRPSITVVELSVQVPVLGDTYDKSYVPILKSGAQITGAGQIFETIDDVDFLSDFSSKAIPNRRIEPNFGNNDVIKSYTITKQEIVVNGVSKVGRRIITTDDYKPFMTIIIPEDNVISIEQVIQVDGINTSKEPTLQEFLTDNGNKFYEVDALAEGRLFLEDVARSSSDIRAGKYFDVTKKFVKEYTENGFCKLIFGGGTSNTDIFNDFIGSLNLNVPFLQNYLNNDALGEIPKANTTLYYRYRVGGGSNTNIGKNVLTNLGTYNMFVNGVREDYNNSVKNSLTVNNPIPALGGTDEPSVEEIRRFISYNFSAQNRCVTTRDYETQVFKMDGKYGAPFRISGREEENKIILSILSLDAKGHLNNLSNDLLKDNIGEYLSKYRLLNDYVEIEDGKIINLSFEVDLLLDKVFNRSEVNANVINEISSYLNITKHDMNENIYLGNLIEKINNVPGVLNIIDIRVFNKIGGDYSLNETSMEYVDKTTRQIKIVDSTIFGESNSMFEIRFKNRDIVLRNKSI